MHEPQILAKGQGGVEGIKEGFLKEVTLQLSQNRY